MTDVNWVIKGEPMDIAQIFIVTIMDGPPGCFCHCHGIPIKDRIERDDCWTDLVSCFQILILFL